MRRTRRAGPRTTHRAPPRSPCRTAETSCSAAARRSAARPQAATAAVPAHPGCSNRMRLFRRLDEGGVDDLGHRQRLDAGHLPEPDLFATRETRRVDHAVIIGDFLDAGDLGDVAVA